MFIKFAHVLKLNIKFKKNYFLLEYNDQWCIIDLDHLTLKCMGDFTELEKKVL